MVKAARSVTISSIMDNTQTILLTESGDLEVYEGKRPIQGFKEVYSSYLFRKDLWLSTKRTVKMAQGEYKKLMAYFVKTMTVTDYYPIDVSDIVEIRDGLGYFKDPVREGEINDELRKALMNAIYFIGFTPKTHVDHFKNGIKAIIDELDKMGFTINRK